MEQDSTRYAGFWIRVGAHIIDAILIIAVTMPLLYLVYGGDYFAPQPGGEPRVVYGLADFLISFVLPAVAVIVFWRWRSATPGKMLCGIRIVDAETLAPMSTAQCVGRYFAYVVSALPLLAGYLWVAVDRRKQGFHDKLAGTLVIREPELADELARLDA